MNRWQLFLAAMTLATLSACAAQQGTTSPGTIPSVAKRPATQMTDLPCAAVSKNDSVMISYPAEALYRNGAVLPREEGLACLDGLAGWLKSAPQSHWQVTVSGEDGRGFDPLQLAGKRQELLQRFFARKGVEVKSWEWQTVIGQGEQLQLLELKDSP